MANQVEVFIDRELGICLRLAWSYRDDPVLRTELTGLTTDIGEVCSASTRRGMKVTDCGLLAEADQPPAAIALNSAKGVAGLASRSAVAGSPGIT